MDYSITSDHVGKIIRLEVFVESREGADLKAAVRAARDAGWHRFLFDDKMADVGTTIWVFFLASDLDAFGFERADRIALVPLDESHEWAELVATNRGWQVQAFGTVKEAEAWLMSATLP